RDTATAVVSITITGTNDGPVANVDTGTTDENAVLRVDVLANDTDVDASDTHIVTAATIAAGLGVVAIVDNKVEWTPGTDYDYLAVGESATVEINYTMEDNNGAEDSSVLTITVTGSNDGPVANVDTGTTDENASLLVDVLANDTDVDDSDTHTVIAATIVSGLGIAAIVNNQVQWTPGTDYDYLALNESATVEINYTIKDNNGAEASSTLALTVTGSNDGPVANVDTGTTDENGALLVDVLANDTDIDASDTHTVTAATIAAGLGVVAIVDNKVEWSPGADYDYLAVGESAKVEISYTMEDNNGAEDSSTLTITVTGSNDGPVANVDTGTTDENASLLVDVLANDTDVDDSDTHTVIAATIVSGLGIAAIVNNQVQWTPGTDYDYLALNESATVEINYTIKDNNGAEASSTLALTVTGSNDGPVANVDTGTTDENGALLVDVLANDTDIDASDTHTVTAATIAAGLGVVAIVDNKVEWSPGADYDYLAVGESAKVEISYTMEDNNGAEDSSTLTITVTGSNDAPTVDYALSRTASEEDTVFTVDLLESAADLDNGAVLSVSDLSVADGKGGWTLNGNQLVIDPHHFDELNTGDLETLNVSYKVTDEKGASVDQTLAINIEGFTDAPSLAAIATAGTAVNELQVKIASQPANDERVVLSFTNLPVGARVLDAARADVTGGVNNFAGTHNFFVVLPPEADADFDFGMTVTGFRADGSEIGSTSGAIDFIYDHTQLNNQVTFSSEDQGIWASGDAPMVQWHEYIPIIGGKTKAWNTATKAWEATDEAPWTSGSFSLFSAEVSAEQAKNIALAGAQATLDAAEDTFNDTAYAIDSAVQSTYNAAVSAFGTALTTAGNVFQAATSKAQEVFDTAINGISQVAEDVAIATYNAAVNAAAAVRDGAIATFGWLGGWVSNSAWAVYNEVVNAAAAAKEAALAGVNWSAEKIAEAAQVTYDAAIAAANWASERAIEAANATFAAAENVYNTAKQAVFDAAKAIFDTAQLAFDVASAALDTVQGKTSLDINADMYAEVGLQIDFVLDSGSVDTEVQYDVASTLQHNRTSDVLMITPHLVNQTTGEAVAFETISPNASLKAALLYDVGANLNVLLDSNLVIGNTVIWDISQGEGPINIGTSVTTGGWAEDFENLKDDIEDLAGDLNLEGISVGELVLIDINTAELDQFEVPFIGTLTEDIVSIELGVPTVQTQGKAAAYSPSYYAEGGLVAVDLGEIVGSVMNLLNARLDFSPELREKLNLGSLQ
ncbi:MAG: Ig-like domain-containing protein, partial [Pseudohongiella sp.]